MPHRRALSFFFGDAVERSTRPCPESISRRSESNVEQRSRSQAGRFGWLVVAALLLLPGPAGAEDDALDPCAQRAVNALQKRYEAVVDLQARFEQTSRSVALGGPGAETRSSGEVVFAKPGRMRWSYREPEPSLVVSDGTWLWIYDPGAREAQKMSVAGGMMSGTAVQFLLGEAEIEREFRVEVRVCSEQEVELILWPREPATYERLAIRIDPRSGDLRATEVVDLLGNVTLVAFDGVKTNVGVAAELFTFEPPEGVELIELRPPTAP
jgi:outer membrane lipoprotein carrier protein